MTEAVVCPDGVSWLSASVRLMVPEPWFKLSIVCVGRVSWCECPNLNRWIGLLICVCGQTISLACQGPISFSHSSILAAFLEIRLGHNLSTRTLVPSSFAVFSYTLFVLIMLVRPRAIPQLPSFPIAVDSRQRGHWRQKSKNFEVIIREASLVLTPSSGKKEGRDQIGSLAIRMGQRNTAGGPSFRRIRFRSRF